MTNLYPPLHAGGYELRCRSVVESMRATGHDVRVLTGCFGALEDSRVEEGVRRSLHVTIGPPYPPEDMQRFLHAESHDRKVLVSVLNEWSPDVVDIWGMEFASQSLVQAIVQSGVAIHFSLDDAWLIDRFSRDPLCHITQFAAAASVAMDEPVRSLCCLGLTPPDLSHGYVSFVSNALAQHYESRGFRHGRTRVRIAGIDAAPLRALPRPTNPSPFEILSLGQLTESRGQQDLIRAAAMVAGRADCPGPIVVRIVGGGNPDHRERIQTLADAAATDGLRFEVVGPVAPEEVGQWYAAAHLFVHTSHLPEGLPRVLMEAMAAGVPIISTDTGGQKDILDNGRWGELIAPHQPETLAGRITECMHNHAEWAERAEHARRHAIESFDTDAYVAGHIDDLEVAIASCSPRKRHAVAFDAPSDLQIQAFVDSLAAAAEEAVAAIDCTKNPDDAWQLGVVLKRCGRIDSANLVFLDLRDKQGEDKTHLRRAAFHLAELAIIDGRWDDAREHIDRCLAVAPDHAKACHNLEYVQTETIPPHLQELAFQEDKVAIVADCSSCTTAI